MKNKSGKVNRSALVFLTAWLLLVAAVVPAIGQWHGSGQANVSNATGVLPIANGGTGGATAAANTAFGNFTGSTAAPAFTTAATVRSSMGCAASGANTDITSMAATGLGQFGTLSSGAGGFTSDADGDTVAKTLDLTGGTIAVADGGTGSPQGAGLIGVGSATYTGNTTLTVDSGHLAKCDTSGGAFALTFPLASTCPAGFPITVYATGNNSLTLTRQGSDTFGGSTSFAMGNVATTVATYICDGASVWIPITMPIQATNGSSNLPLRWSANQGYQTSPNLPGLTGTGALSSGSIASGFGNISNTGSITASTTVTATSGAITATNGNVVLNTAGNHIQIKEGSNAMMGTVTLSGGTADFSTTAVAAGDRVFLQRVSGTSAEFGHLSYVITAATKVAITSTDAQDDSVVNVLIVRPAP